MTSLDNEVNKHEMFEEIRYHVNNEWMIFDDSKRHYAENTSEDDRIVLIIDIERPEHVKQGTSDATDTKELEEFVTAFKRNIKELPSTGT